MKWIGSLNNGRGLRTGLFTRRFIMEARWGLGLLVMVSVFVTAGPAFGDAGGDRLLSRQRWHEESEGVSLRVPEGSRLYERVVEDTVPWALGPSSVPKLVLQDLAARFRLDPNRHDLPEEIGRRRVMKPGRSAFFISHNVDDSLLRIEGDIDYVIRLYLKEMKLEQHVYRVAMLGRHDLAANTPNAIMLEERKLKVDGRPAALVYYRIPKDRGDAAQGHAFVQIGSRKFAFLRFETPHILLRQTAPVFESVLNSLRVADPHELASQRKENLERGEMWRQMLDAKHLRLAKRDVQLLRIVQGKDDIGYMTIEMVEATELNLPGLKVTVRARILEAMRTLDTESHFQLSDDDTHELWTITTTSRPRGSARGDPTDVMTWVETGLRFKDRLEVSREGETGPRKTSVWQKPPTAYLSQVELHLMEALLPHKTEQVMGFYAYLPSVNKVTYRTVRITPLADGGYRVRTRASPDHGLSAAEYGRDGRLRWRLMAGGRRLITATKEQFRKIWNVP